MLSTARFVCNGRLEARAILSRVCTIRGRMTKALGIVSLIGALLLLGGGALVSAQGTQGPGSFGGELRGVTRVKGKVLCVSCTLKEAKAANPEVQAHLY